MSGVRERARVQITAEIKRTAKRHLTRDGAAGLSLRAVARDLDMASSAVYRYFPSRDDLLTALIIDAYDAFGVVAERADAGVERDDLFGRWRAVGWAAYRWSGRHAAEYALIFGSPVPGYAAPEDTIGPARRFTNVLTNILSDARQAGLRPANIPPLDLRVKSDIEDIRHLVGTEVEGDWFASGLRGWTSLIGLINFIRFGPLLQILSDHDAYFDYALDEIGRSVIGESPT